MCVCLWRAYVRARACACTNRYVPCQSQSQSQKASKPEPGGGGGIEAMMKCGCLRNLLPGYVKYYMGYYGRKSNTGQDKPASRE